MTKSTKPKKGDIPVLSNPRLNTSEYTNPMEVVLFTEGEKEYKVKDLYNEVVALRKENNKVVANFNKLVEFMKEERQEVK